MCWRWSDSGFTIKAVDVPVELRQLRYFVAVAEELHFGRAAERLHMSQSPLSRAIRELERELGLVLFVRTTRQVELTPAGVALLDRTRRALAELDAAIIEARRAVDQDGLLRLGYMPFSEPQVTRIAEELQSERPELHVRLEDDVTPDLLRRVATHELTGAAVLETPAAAHHHGVRVDTLRDEPLLAALPASHAYAEADAIPMGAFVAERVLLPREPAGLAYNNWLRAVLRTAGFELERTLETLSAPWDRRMLHVAGGETVSTIVGEWTEESIDGVVAVPFDPAVNIPIDLATSVTDEGELVASTARRLRDAEGWLTYRPARTDRPD